MVNDVEPKDRDIAMVFQNYALYPDKSVSENMGFGLKMRNVERSEIEGRVRRAAEILRIESLLARRPAQLSGGQRQRVGVLLDFTKSHVFDAAEEGVLCHGFDHR